jgi:hypothetical protein
MRQARACAATRIKDSRLRNTSAIRDRGWRINQQMKIKLQFLDTKSGARFQACDINALTKSGKNNSGG